MWTDIWYCLADVLPFSTQARDKPCIGRVWESGGDGCQTLDHCDPFLDHGEEPFLSFLARANKSANISLPMAVAHRKGCVSKDLASMRFGGWRTDDPAFLRLRVVSHARSMAAEQVEEVHDMGGQALEGKVICIPGLEDGWVRSPEGFSEWH